nr:hypothetical protein [Myxococcota bacterium]
MTRTPLALVRSFFSSGLSIIVLAISVLAMSSPTAAQQPPQQPSVRVDPAIAEALAGRRPAAPFFAARGAMPDRDRVAVLIELRERVDARPGTLDALRGLANDGVALRAPEGRTGRASPA